MTAQSVATINSQLGGGAFDLRIIQAIRHGGTAGYSYYVDGEQTPSKSAVALAGRARWVDALDTDTAEQVVTAIKAAMSV